MRIFFWILLSTLGFIGNAQITFVVESLPQSTPASDTIFIAGTFNNWMPNDPRFALKLLNGRLAITLPLAKERHEYKFTRGNWLKVETDFNNRNIENRTFIYGESNTVNLKIENWLDLGGAKRPSYMLFYFFSCAFQCIALCLLAYRAQRKDIRKFKSLVLTNSVFTCLLTLFVFYQTTNQIWQGYLTLVFNVGLFSWAPLVLYLVDTFNSGNGHAKFNHYIPLILAALLVTIRIINIPTSSFLGDLAWAPLTWISVLLFATGFVFNAVIYCITLNRFTFLKLKLKLERDPKTSFLYFYFWVSVIAFLFVPLNVVLILNGVRNPFIENFSGVALVLSSLIFIETYYLWKFPEIIKEEKLPTHVQVGDQEHWVIRLNTLMRNERPYKNTDLTISDLADLLGVKSHALSRIISDNYQKNFRDFVNNYRIEEFICKVESKEFNHLTFFALAQEVGFNSKSTFNLAFKKLTGQCPRDYFKYHQEISS